MKAKIAIWLSNPDKLVFSLLLLFLPTQLAFHFWPDWALVYGIRVDYLAPTLYFTDILTFVLLVLVAKKIHLSKKFLLLIFILFNIVFAHIAQIAVLYWLRFLEGYFLVFYVSKNRKEILKNLETPLSLAIIYVSLIAFGQFFLQKTIGGPLYWLGERSFNSSTPGIALANYFGEILMRPYSIFPHPNALAGFLAVSIFLLISQKTKKITTKTSIIFAVLVIFLTFSKTVWFASLFCLIILLLRKHLNLKFLKIILFSIITFTSLFFAFGKSPSKSEGIYKRFELSRVSLKIWESQPVFGVGLGNSITLLPTIAQKYPKIISPSVSWWLQPVHNIYLLILSETGLVGFLLFLYLVIRIFRNSLKIKPALPAGRNWKLVISIMLILLTGLFDHYWLTIHQNFLLASILLGLLT
ncbi:MAG: O-antigen ligase family protein [Candidatus Woesebacteria bacterium]|nr:MAG: O-antigen ligase family protein [Candidatus Woesebacteria bacterium]